MGIVNEYITKLINKIRGDKNGNNNKQNKQNN